MRKRTGCTCNPHEERPGLYLEPAVKNDPALLGACKSNHPKYSVAVAIISSSEKQLIGISIRSSQTALAELDRPKPIDLNCISLRVSQRTQKRSAFRVKRVDPPARS